MVNESEDNTKLIEKYKVATYKLKVKLTTPLLDKESFTNLENE